MFGNIAADVSFIQSMTTSAEYLPVDKSNRKFHHSCVKKVFFNGMDSQFIVTSLSQTTSRVKLRAELP